MGEIYVYEMKARNPGNTVKAKNTVFYRLFFRFESFFKKCF